MQQTIRLGEAVRVSNGEPRPPHRFTQKLQKWESANFSGIYLGEVSGHRLVQVFGRSLRDMGAAVFIRWLEPTSKMTSIDPEATRFPVFTPGEPVRASELIASQLERMRVTTDHEGNRQVHTFLEAGFYSGADIDLDEAEALVRNAELIVDVPERYRSMRHAIGRRCPATGRGIFFETLEVRGRAAQAA
jgi:hypothetical protein